MEIDLSKITAIHIGDTSVQEVKINGEHAWGNWIFPFNNNGWLYIRQCSEISTNNDYLELR